MCGKSINNDYLTALKKLVLNILGLTVIKYKKIV